MAYVIFVFNALTAICSLPVLLMRFNSPRLEPSHKFYLAGTYAFLVAIIIGSFDRIVSGDDVKPQSIGTSVGLILLLVSAYLGWKKDRSLGPSRTRG